MAYNRLIVEGRLTADPELRQTTAGVTVANVTIAVDRPARKGAEKETDFFSVTAWRGTAEFLATYFKKGDGILAEGPFQSRRYEDKDGTKKTAWAMQVDRVHFTEGRHSKGGSSASAGDDFTEIGDNEDLPF